MTGDFGMAAKMILTGDVNLMNVADPAVPFALVGDELRQADVVFSNLECCLAVPVRGHSVNNEGFFADPVLGGEALRRGGIQAVGIANNVHYGDAHITASIARLDELGIAHAVAGANLAAARAPVVLERAGMRFGFLQRSSVYWPTNHEAREDAAGIAVIRGHTAYHVPVFKTRVGMPPPNRPGVPPDIITWADAAYLRAFTDDIAALRPQADIVMGHGPHYSLPVGTHKGKPIFYGLGNLSFDTGHGGRKHGDWLGMVVRATAGRNGIADVGFGFVRHNDRNETVPCGLDKEADELTDIAARSAPLGARLRRDGDQVRVERGA